MQKHVLQKFFTSWKFLIKPFNGTLLCYYAKMTFQQTFLYLITFLLLLWARFILVFDDDDDVDDDEFSCGMVDGRKVFMPYFYPGPLSEILTTASLWNTASRIWTCTESELRLCWMKLCSSNNYYNMVLFGDLTSLTNCYNTNFIKDNLFH